MNDSEFDGRLRAKTDFHLIAEVSDNLKKSLAELYEKECFRYNGLSRKERKNTEYEHRAYLREIVMQYKRLMED